MVLLEFGGPDYVAVGGVEAEDLGGFADGIDAVILDGGGGVGSAFVGVGQEGAGV